ncbi:MAG TPA: hypothetical protein VLD62_03325 [Acidimicrobiia bacterium]|nr:hypothetical protein [Acidimicrobiia bacterium]
MAIAFTLLALLVQVVGLSAARHRASAVVAAAALDASLPDAAGSEIQRRVTETISATVPGAESIVAMVTGTRTEVAVRVRFRWIPPGPDWIPVWVGATAVATRVVPP